MKYAEEIMQQHAEQKGWTDATALAVALEYIQNQQANDAFEDFLAERD